MAKQKTESIISVAQKIDDEKNSGNYQIRPNEKNDFKANEVKNIIADVMQQILDGNQ